MLKFIVSPVFAALAMITHTQPAPLCTVGGSWGFLSSMAFMYALMAAAHSGPWLQLARTRIDAACEAGARRLGIRREGGGIV